MARLRKINGKHIETYYKENNGLVTRTLEIYELKTGLKAVLWNSSFKGWKEVPNEPIATKFYPFKTSPTCVYIASEWKFI